MSMLTKSSRRVGLKQRVWGQSEQDDIKLVDGSIRLKEG